MDVLGEQTALLLSIRQAFKNKSIYQSLSMELNGKSHCLDQPNVAFGFLNGSPACMT